MISPLPKEALSSSPPPLAPHRLQEVNMSKTATCLFAHVQEIDVASGDLSQSGG
jgi:hypothetical protein